MSDMIFCDGLIVKRRDNAPEFVVANLSIKVDEFTVFLDEHRAEGWVNIDIKISKGGKMYASLDQWRPTQGEDAKAGMEQAREVVGGAAGMKQAETATGADFGDFEDEIPF